MHRRIRSMRLIIKISFSGVNIANLQQTVSPGKFRFIERKIRIFCEIAIKARRIKKYCRDLFYADKSEFRRHCSATIFLTIRHGLPTAMQSAGMSCVTTDPAPITALSPIVTPGSTVTLAPSQAFSPIVIGRSLKTPFSLSTGSIE